MSNAGPIVDGEDSLLVDTLFDLPCTPISTLVAPVDTCSREFGHGAPSTIAELRDRQRA